MNSDTNFLSRYFGVFGQARTYLNLLYLLLAFPLGVFYFVFLVTGVSLGIPLIIVWIGILILALVLAASWAFTAFERQLAIGLLRVDVPPMNHQQVKEDSFWQQMKSYLANPVTWKGLLFLFLKFPIGIITFVLTVTLLSISLGMIAAPILYPYGQINMGFWNIDTLNEAAFVCFVGVMILPAILHLFNIISGWLGEWAKVMLGNKQPVQMQASPAPQLPPDAPLSNPEI
jgi:hypothetical protein